MTERSHAALPMVNTVGLRELGAIDEGSWHRLADRFIPEHARVDPEELRRARTGVGAALIVMPFSLLFALSYQFTLSGVTADHMTGLVLLALPVCLTSLLLYRLTGARVLGPVLVLSWALACFVGIAYALGGAHAPARFWMILLPVGATIIMGRTAGLVWLGLSLFASACLFAAAQLGYVFPQGASDAQLERVWVNSVTSRASLRSGRQSRRAPRH